MQILISQRSNLKSCASSLTINWRRVEVKKEEWAQPGKATKSGPPVFIPIPKLPSTTAIKRLQSFWTALRVNSTCPSEISREKKTTHRAALRQCAWRNPENSHPLSLVVPPLVPFSGSTKTKPAFKSLQTLQRREQPWTFNDEAPKPVLAKFVSLEQCDQDASNHQVDKKMSPST